MQGSEVTDFLVHNLFSDFPVYAEALWEIIPEPGSEEGAACELPTQASTETTGRSKSRKRRKVHVGTASIQSSAQVHSAGEKWWAFVMHGFEYVDARENVLERRAVVSVQYMEDWKRGKTGNERLTDDSVYTGVKAEVVFYLKMSGKGHGLWMKEIDVDDHAVRVRLMSATAPAVGCGCSDGGQVPDVAVGQCDGPTDEFAGVSGSFVPTVVPSPNMDMRVNSLNEEMKNLRSTLNSQRAALLLSCSVGNELKSRLRVLGVSRILQCLSASRPPLALEKLYKFSLSPSHLDGCDVCGNAEVEVFLGDATFSEFQDLMTQSVHPTESDVGGRAYLSPSQQAVSCYNPLTPQPMSIVFPFLSDFCDTVGMSLSQRVLDVFRPPRREAAVPCILGSTEMFRGSESGLGPRRRDVFLGVCHTSLQVLMNLRPVPPNYNVPMLRLGNSSLNAETMESNNDFVLVDGKSRDIVEGSQGSSISGTGKSSGFRLKWTPLGWNMKKGSAVSGVYGKITAILSIVFMKDKKLSASALSSWTPMSEDSENGNGGAHDSVQALMEKILCTPTSD